MVFNLKTMERFDLLAFNNTCSEKYQRLDRTYTFEGEPLQTDKDKKSLARLARDRGPKMFTGTG